MHYLQNTILALNCVYCHLQKDSVRKLATGIRALPWVRRITWEN